MTRNIKNNLLAEFSAFEGVIDQAKRAVSSTRKNKLKLLTECRVMLQQSYMKLATQWGLYEADVLEKENISINAFNAVDDVTGKPKYEMNGDWKNLQLKIFGDLLDEIDDLLETEDVKPEVVEEDQERSVAKAKAEMTHIETDVDSFVKEMSDVEELTEIKFRGLMTQVGTLRARASGVADMFGDLSDCDVDVKLFGETVEAKLQSLETSSMLKLKEGVSGSTGGYGGLMEVLLEHTRKLT